MLKSGKHRVAVRRHLDSITIQVVEFNFDGDKTVADVSSKSLEKLGWRGHGGSIPSAYLTGLLIGLKARKLGVSEAVLDIGLQKSVKGNAIYAAAAGIKDAGIKMPLGDVVPTQERISGAHIASYAARLKKESQDKYKKQFSSYIKKGLDPESIPSHFSEVKGRILAENSVSKKMIETHERA